MKKLFTKLKNWIKEKEARSHYQSIEQSLAEDNLEKVIALESLGGKYKYSKEYDKACKELNYYSPHLTYSDHDKFRETDFYKEMMLYDSGI